MATTTTPGSFRLPGYSIAVGPFSHLAAERDRLSRADVAPLRRRAPRLDGRRGDLGRRPARRAARRRDRGAAPGPLRLQGHLLPGPAPHAAAARRVRPALRRPRDPPVPAVEHRRARAGALREDGRGQRLRELVAPRRHLARVPVDGCHPARGERARARWRHALRRHVRGLRVAGRGDQVTDRRPGGGARLHPDLRARHDQGGAREGAGAVPARWSTRSSAPTPARDVCISTSTGRS